MNSQGMAFKIPIYVYILGFELLPSIYAIAVPEMCHVFPKKILAIHTEKLKAQENNGWDVLSSLFTRIVLVAFWGKKCQSIYNRKNVL